MRNRNRWKKAGFWRALIQGGFLLWMLWLGAQFFLFVRHFTSGGSSPLVPRPPGVEGFLPIGALLSARHWLASGDFHPVHPAALVLLLTILGLSLLARKSFCSWICPVGTISEWLGRAGRKLFGRNFRIWKGLDIPLRGIKYLLLFFFMKTILLDMPAAALSGFLNSPYWAASDVKMLYFFTRPSAVTVAVLSGLAMMSMLFRDAWCRYLCPYGALLGLAALFSPFKIRRNANRCKGCRSCTAACPAALPLHERKTIRSAECSGCLTCVDSCPQPQTLQMSLPFTRGTSPWWIFAGAVLLLFAAGLSMGILTGHWESSLTYADYLWLIPRAAAFGH